MSNACKLQKVTEICMTSYKVWYNYVQIMASSLEGKAT